MSDELSPAERFAHEDEEVFVPRDLEQGASEEEIVARLVRLDWEPDAARAYVREFQAEQELWRGTPEQRQALVEHYFRQMLGGAVILALSVLTSVGSFLAAAVLGGFSLILFGAAGLGLFMLTNGYSRWQRYRRMPDDSDCS